MPPTLLAPAAYRRMPWKNGGGTTVEIAVAPSADGRFLWRVSVADVAASGPFSAFDGYDRLIAVVDGAGMRLTIDGAPADLRPGDGALAFSGDATVDCTLLDGPIRDFNLIVDRERMRGWLDLVTPERALSVPPARAVLVHAVAGEVTVRAVEAETRVPAGWTLRLDGQGAEVAAEAGASALVARVDDR